MPESSRVLRSRSRFWSGQIHLTLAAAVGGLALTGSIALGLRSWERSRVAEAFAEAAEVRAEAIDQTIEGELDVLLFLQSFFTASQDVARGEFGTFLAEPRAKRPELVAIEWIPRVDRDERATLEAAVRAEGFPEFRIEELDAEGRLVPAGDRDEYFPVVYAEPLAGSERNRMALGFDYASRPRRFRAMAAAREQGRPVATEPIALFRFDDGAGPVGRDPADVLAYVVFAPVRDAAGAFVGYVSAVFRVEGLVSEALAGFRAGEARMRVLDATEPDAEPVFVDGPITPDPPADLSVEIPVEFAGRMWLVVATPTEEFVDRHRQWYSTVALVLGLVGTAIGARALGRLAGEKKRLQEELDRFWALSPDLLCVAGMDGTFRRLNPAWETVLGYRLDELVGRRYEEFVHPDDLAATGAEAARVAAGERTIDFENRYRCADGSWRWLRWTAIGQRRRGLIYATARDSTERVRAREELERLSTTDPLTGVLNRRAFGARLDDEVKRAIRYEHPLAVAMVDGDHFKKVNDTHGHAAGDEVLRRMAAALLRSVRETDAVARFGGEEFVVLMPETALDAARAIAERIREEVAGESYVGAGGVPFSITCSVGVAGLDGRAGADHLVGAADEALYRAKHGGRNRVEVAG